MKRVYISSAPAREALLRDIISYVERLSPDANQGTIDHWDYCLIYKGRNRIYRFTSEQGDFAVKCFGPLSWWRRIYYSWIGTSKARRSYLHTRELERRGISTPSALGYVEEYDRWSILGRSYYVCSWVETEGSSIHPHMGGTLAPDGFLPALASFLAEVHRQGVEHLDLSPGNILYNIGERGVYRFYLVDVNRMDFAPEALSLSQSLRNLDRLIWNPSVSTAFAHYYALERAGERGAKTNDLTSRKIGLGGYVRSIEARYNLYCDRFWEHRLIKLIVRYNKYERGIPSIKTLAIIKCFYSCARLWLILPSSCLRSFLFRKMEHLYIEYLAVEDYRQVLRRRYGFSYQLGKYLRRS